MVSKALLFHHILSKTKTKIGVCRNKPYVLFVNPIDEKGLQIASKIASLLPDIPFHYVKAWSFDHDRASDLQAAIRGVKNVTVQRSQRKMNNVYGNAKIVIAPSKWEEAWGRIASEAQEFGIPVVSSNIEGLAEAVGPGGILIDPKAPIETWVQAVKSLWNDKYLYSELSTKAHEHAARPSISADAQMNKIMSVVHDAIQDSGADSNAMIP